MGLWRGAKAKPRYLSERMDGSRAKLNGLSGNLAVDVCRQSWLSVVIKNEENDMTNLQFGTKEYDLASTQRYEDMLVERYRSGVYMTKYDKKDAKRIIKEREARQ